MTRFERDTSVRRVDDTTWAARMDPGWFISRGPNGGYVAAVVLRALQEAVGDPERSPRSLTLHFTSPPQEGPVQIETSIERSGRSMTTASARLRQEEHLRAVGLAAFSRARPGPELHEARMPRVLDAVRAEPLGTSHSPIRERYHTRSAIPEDGPGDERPARCGGWIRLGEPQPVDAFVVAAFSDGWPPALMQRAWPEGQTPPRGYPTVDLTVHFRGALPLADVDPADFWLVQFRTRVVRDGFLEEDGEIWSPDGRLVAHSRQLGALL